MSPTEVPPTKPKSSGISFAFQWLLGLAGIWFVVCVVIPGIKGGVREVQRQSGVNSGQRCPHDGNYYFWTGRTEVVNGKTWYVMTCVQGHTALQETPPK